MKMTREQILNTIGFGIFGICYLFATIKILFHTTGEQAAQERTIRFAHWQLEGGIQAAFDQISKEYMDKHPGVRVVQLVIPERIYPTWATTQLVGGTAPDLFQLPNLPDDKLSRYFVPLTQWVERPNSYNKGTNLESVEWRNTFIDGLKGPPNYNVNLLEYYAVPNSVHTVRIYYNKDLYKEIAGDAPVPANYNQFLELCAKIKSYNERTGQKIFPVAGSKYNGPILVNHLFSSQTQKLRRRLDLERNWEPTPLVIGQAYLRGDWNLNDPGVISGLNLLHDVGQHMQPGFMQLSREDSTFYFLQQRALMILAGSWDAPTFKTQATFPFGAFKLPVPSALDAEYREKMFGVSSEASTGTSNAFGLTKSSSNQKLALDFLQFMTSKMSNETFARVSGWLPAVVGVDPIEEMKVFSPIQNGTTSGFSLELGTETRRVCQNNFYQLFRKDGTADEYVKTIEKSYDAALLEDLNLARKNLLRNVQLSDTILAAFLIGNPTDTDLLTGAPSYSLVFENQSGMEQNLYWLQYQLNTRKKKL